jgi:hypothetical protein
MKVLAITLASGDIYRDGGEGDLISPADAGVHRFHRMVYELPRSLPYLIVCTAGFSKRRPKKQVPERHVSLADQIRHYAEETFPVYDNPTLHKCLCTEALCWGTRNQIEKGIEIALQKGFRENEHVTLLLSSHRAHSLRVCMCAQNLAPKKWYIKFLKTTEEFGVKCKLREIPAFFSDAKELLRG